MASNAAAGSGSKAKSKAQKKRDKERLAKAQMTQELNLMDQMSKAGMHPSASAPGDIAKAAGNSNLRPVTPRATNQSGGSSGSGGTPPTGEAVANSNRNKPLSTLLWPPAPKIPPGQALSYGWPVPFPASPDSLRPTPLGAINNVGESSELKVNSGAFEDYKEARRQRYVKAANQSGLTWNLKA